MELVITKNQQKMDIIMQIKQYIQKNQKIQQKKEFYFYVQGNLARHYLQVHQRTIMISKNQINLKSYMDTYIGKNPTKLRNSYHILKFNFSGIDTSDEETTMKGFKKEVASSIEVFVKKYGLDFYINIDDEAENILDNLIKAFGIQKTEEKIYVIIDEYDHFANELLGWKSKKMV